MMIPKKRPTAIGEFIQEDILNEFNMSQGDLAQTLKVSRKKVNHYGLQVHSMIP